MTVKTTLGFTDRHRRFLTEQVEKGVYATASVRAATPREAYRDEDETFAAALADIAASDIR